MIYITVVGDDSEHNGIHFHVKELLPKICRNIMVKVMEKEREFNPVTIVNMDEDSYCEMETIQIKGVDSTKREMDANLGKGAK